MSDTDGFLIGCIVASIIFTIIGFAVFKAKLGEPQAIDVYKGKTTLEITYKDGVAIDSVVVFK